MITYRTAVWRTEDRIAPSLRIHDLFCLCTLLPPDIGWQSCLLLRHDKFVLPETFHKTIDPQRLPRDRIYE